MGDIADEHIVGGCFFDLDGECGGSETIDGDVVLDVFGGCLSHC